MLLNSGSWLDSRMPFDAASRKEHGSWPLHLVRLRRHFSQAFAVRVWSEGDRSVITAQDIGVGIRRCCDPADVGRLEEEAVRM